MSITVKLHSETQVAHLQRWNIAMLNELNIALH